ncbi:hypothetical protein GCM10023238_36970 [Streptomyces heliomycini]
MDAAVVTDAVLLLLVVTHAVPVGVQRESSAERHPVGLVPADGADHVPHLLVQQIRLGPGIEVKSRHQVVVTTRQRAKAAGVPGATEPQGGDTLPHRRGGEGRGMGRAPSGLRRGGFLSDTGQRGPGE